MLLKSACLSISLSIDHNLKTLSLQSKIQILKYKKNKVLDRTLYSLNSREQKRFLPKPKEEICGNETDS